MTYPRTRALYPGTRHERVVIISHTDNIRTLLDTHQITVRNNNLTKEIEIEIPNKTFNLQGGEDARSIYIQDLCAVDEVPTTRLPRQLIAIANENEYHPVRDWLKSLRWDGTSRFDQILGTLQVEETSTPRNIAEMYLRKILVMAVAVVCEPRGISPQGVFVLVGPQGIGKTTWIKHLVPPEFHHWVTTDLHINPHNRHDIMRFIRAWIVELAELDGIMRRNTVEALKPFISGEVPALIEHPSSSVS